MKQSTGRALRCRISGRRRCVEVWVGLRATGGAWEVVARAPCGSTAVHPSRCSRVGSWACVPDLGCLLADSAFQGLRTGSDKSCLQDMSLPQATARILRGAARRLDPPPTRPAPPPPRPRLPDSYRSGPGSRVASYFFRDYRRFYSTGAAGITSRPRLNLRYEAIFGENKDLFEGARVLDIASHDGRWSMAALACGARSVVGIEARPELVDHAVGNLEHYGQDPDTFRFIVGDVHEVLRSEDLEADVILCLGFLYHTLRFTELLHGIRRTNASHLVLDTQAQRMLDPHPFVRVHREGTQYMGHAKADAYSVGEHVLTGRPNLSAIRLMLGCYGYEVERLSDWARLLADNPEVKACGDYAVGRRITLRCRKAGGDSAA
jgi:Methyltransferase domain